MANDASDGVILTDGRGNYYTLARATIEQGRVADAYKGEVERFLQGDTSGYIGVQVQPPALSVAGGFTAPRGGTLQGAEARPVVRWIENCWVEP
jgi:hypothetical protein